MNTAMAISFSARVSAPADVLVSQLAGESVILNLNSECYFGLDEMGTNMWTALTKAESIQAAYDSLLAEYEVSADQLKQDLTELLDKLIDKGLLEVAGG
jgi:coenzyme PQQ synthesis protein D (PqqD)